MSRTKFMLSITCILLLTVTNIQAQSWKDIFNKENVSNVVNTITGKSIDIAGTWTYSGSAIKFKSDNLLKQAGGALAANSIESKFDNSLSKVGIREGITQFTFNADSTFTSTMNNRTLNGTYSYDESTQNINLKYSRLMNYSAKLELSSSKMSLLFDADKLFSLLVFMGNKASSSALKSITTLAEGYDGMLMGLEFTTE